MSIERLRALINQYPGTWDEKVSRFAETNGRSRSSIYRWLSSGPPENIIDAIEYRMIRELKTHTSDEWPV